MTSISPPLEQGAGPSPEAASTLQHEVQLFNELFSRLIDSFLNRFFDLRPTAATRRSRILVVLFFVVVFLLSLQLFPLYLWTQTIRDIFLYVLNMGYALTYPGNPFLNLVGLVDLVFTDPRIFQYFPLFLASFFIALQCAALYLADVFELDDPGVARRFLLGVALLGSEETIRVSQGEVLEECRLSPAFLIGGPGKVIVDLDSVALFEKPDGTPHVIGPTGNEPRGRASLEGFERFRQAIDIRDQYVDLTVKSRSLDGIEITATDVRLMFSIYRGNGKLSVEQPYPFSKDAVRQIIYQATSRVTPELSNPSTYEFSWINKMIGLIRSELGTFMGRHKLTAYLASMGTPEIEKLRQREAEIDQQKLTQDQDFLLADDPQTIPEFQPRSKITDLFTQFADEFTKKAKSSGVELHWIGVGTWQTPVHIVPERHLEAWKLSNDNLHRESPEELSELHREAIMQKLVSLLQDVPVAAYLRATSEEKDHKKTMRTLLLAYHQQLKEATEFMRAKGEAVPPNIEDAIAHINNMFGHFL